MRWNKLRKIIIENPYLISDDFHMSMQQAKEIQEQEGYRSFDEMVSSARRRSHLPDSAWQSVYAAIEKQRGRTTPKPNQRKVTSGRLAIRWAIVGLCILLATGYFTLVPSGKALAAPIAKVILQIFDDGFLFTPTTTPVPSQDTGSSEGAITDFEDFDAAEEAIGRQFLQINDDAYTLDSLQLYDSSIAGKTLCAFYETDTGLTISLYHNWDMTTDYWSQISQHDTVWEESLSDGTVVYCTMNSIDQSFTAYALWNNSFITIYADDGIPYTEVLASIYLPASTPVLPQDGGNAEDTIEDSIVELIDYKDAETRIGRPLIRLIGDKFRLNTLTLYESDIAGSLLDSSYCTQDGLHITLQQEWNVAGSPWVELDTAHTWEETLWDEVTLYCYIDAADDNKFTATAAWRDCIITIYADEGIPYTEVLASIYLPNT